MNGTFENLVFKGGGIKGIAYLGMLQVLEENQMLANIKQVAGASAGAITATLVALADTYEELEKMMMSLDFSKIPDKGTTGEEHMLFKEIEKLLGKEGEDILCIDRLVKHFGWYTSEYFYEWLKKTIETKYYGGNAIPKDALERKVTFKMFEQRFKRKLKVVGTDMSTISSQIFSVDTTPDIEVATAVRISMSIPLFFESINAQCPGEKEENVFSDGGVVWNYPLTLFDEGGIVNTKTLGGRLFTPKEYVKSKPVKNLIGYIESAFEALLAVQDINFDLSDDVDKMRTVNINDFGIPATQFDLSIDEQEKLKKSGRDATLEYLKNYTK